MRKCDNKILKQYHCHEEDLSKKKLSIKKIARNVSNYHKTEHQGTISISEELDFNEEFRRAFTLIENTNSTVFITGKAGTGKSTILKFFFQKTKKKIVLLAPTGVAALNIGGATIHSFFRFPPRPITEEDIHKVYDPEIYKYIETIVIDEISMVRADMLDAIDKFLRLNRDNPSRPFGGVQMVFFGDLYQLSPVVSDEEEAKLFGSYYDSPWFFDSKVIGEIELIVIELTKVYRQKDSRFIEILDSVRTNQATQREIHQLNMQYMYSNTVSEKNAIILTCTNRRAKEINEYRLNLLSSPEYTFVGRIEGKFPQKTLPTDIELRLKVGAQIMFVKNDLLKRWVNGTIGIICRLDDTSIEVEFVEGGETFRYLISMEKWEILKFRYNSSLHRIESQVVGQFLQYPLKLAWAVTIHKSQGLTFDNLVIDLESGAFAYGQTYVALSRCTSLEGITLNRPIRYSDIKVDIQINKYFERLKTKETKILAQPISKRDNLGTPYKQSKSDLGNRSYLWAVLIIVGLFILLGAVNLLRELPLFLGKDKIPTNTAASVLLIPTKTQNLPVLLLKPSSLSTTTPSTAPSVTPTPSCRFWQEITLDDVGKSECVYGEVIGIFLENDIFYIKFSQNISEFFAISYGGNFPEVVSGVCIQFYGLIERIGSSPVIVLSSSSNLQICESDLAP